MNIKILLAILFSMLLSGCMGFFGPDKEGWRLSQKNEFLEILKTDKYMSICDQGNLYRKVLSNENSKLMTKLLMAYVNNLANSCIDLESFEKSQQAKQAREIETYFEMNQEEIEKSDIMMKLKSGQHIEQILQPFIPTTPQFFALINQYKVFKKASNITSKRLKKIRLNIERAKLMKAHVGNNYALVNIPEFKVRMIEEGNTTLSFPVIVGKTNMQTPIFSERLKYVEINPQWNVPDSIMRKSYISKIISNPGWVRAEGMELHKESYDLRSPKVDPASVDWSEYPKDEKGYIPYKLVQIPSRKNGLGRVKFIFPNKHAVYMHDTQSKSLFKKKIRAFSHGCIRLGKPKALLDHVTMKYSDKNLTTVKKWYKSLKTKHLILNKDLHVHTTYYTAYVNDKGTLQLFPDIYGFDKSQRLNF